MRHALAERKGHAVGALASEKRVEQLARMGTAQREEMVRAMFAADFEDVFDAAASLEANVRGVMERVIAGYVRDREEGFKGVVKEQVLGMPPGVGYLLVECRHAPRIRRPRKGGTFGRMTKVSYGLQVATLIDEANACLKRLASGAKGIRSSL